MKLFMLIIYCHLTITCGEGGMPDQGESIIEDVGWVQSRLTGVSDSGPIGLSHLYVHKLGDVQGKGNGSNGNDVDQ